MWKNCEGFTLLESLASLSIVIILTMSIIPAMMWMLYEQRIIDYEAQGMLYLENALQTWKYDGVMQTTETYKNVKYYFDRIHLENGHVQLCVNWIFKREHEQCGIT